MLAAWIPPLCRAHHAHRGWAGRVREMTLNHVAEHSLGLPRSS
jgi:hypothetical protein